MDELSHLDDRGNARMVDVSGKAETVRTAKAEAVVQTSKAVMAAVKSGSVPKGDVLAVCRVAGIMSAKKTAGLIPMCHPLPLDAVSIEIELTGSMVRITASASTSAKTGLEMEVMTAASIAALTFYDMCKSMDKGITIHSVRLLEKSGGKSGDYKRQGEK